MNRIRQLLSSSASTSAASESNDTSTPSRHMTVASGAGSRNALSPNSQQNLTPDSPTTPQPLDSPVFSLSPSLRPVARTKAISNLEPFRHASHVKFFEIEFSEELRPSWDDEIAKHRDLEEQQEEWVPPVPLLGIPETEIERLQTVVKLCELDPSTPSSGVNYSSWSRRFEQWALACSLSLKDQQSTEILYRQQTPATPASPRLAIPTISRARHQRTRSQTLSSLSSQRPVGEVAFRLTVDGRSRELVSLNFRDGTCTLEVEKDVTLGMEFLQLRLSESQVDDDVTLLERRREDDDDDDEEEEGNGDLVYKFDSNTRVISFGFGSKDDDVGYVVLAFPPRFTVGIVFHSMSAMIQMFEMLRQGLKVLRFVADERVMKFGRDNAEGRNPTQTIIFGMAGLYTPSARQAFDPRGIHSVSQSVKVRCLLQKDTVSKIELSFRELFERHENWCFASPFRKRFFTHLSKKSNTNRHHRRGASGSTTSSSSSSSSSAQETPNLICWTRNTKCLDAISNSKSDFRGHIWAQQCEVWKRKMFEEWLKRIFVQGRGASPRQWGPPALIQTLRDRLARVPLDESRRAVDSDHFRLLTRGRSKRCFHASLLKAFMEWFDDVPSDDTNGKLWVEELARVLGLSVAIDREEENESQEEEEEEEGEGATIRSDSMRGFEDHPLAFFNLPELRPEKDALVDAVFDLLLMNRFPQGKYLILKDKGAELDHLCQLHAEDTSRSHSRHPIIPPKGDMRVRRRFLREHSDMWDPKAMRDELLFMLLYGLSSEAHCESINEKAREEMRQNSHFALLQRYTSYLDDPRDEYPHYARMNFELFRDLEAMKCDEIQRIIQQKRAVVSESASPSLTSPFVDDDGEFFSPPPDEDTQALKVRIEELKAERTEVEDQLDRLEQMFFDDEDDDPTEEEDSRLDELNDQKDYLTAEIGMLTRRVGGGVVAQESSRVLFPETPAIVEAELDRLQEALDARRRRFDEDFPAEEKSPAYLLMRAKNKSALVQRELAQSHESRGSFFLIPLQLCLSHLHALDADIAASQSASLAALGAQVGKMFSLDSVRYGMSHVYPIILNVLCHWTDISFVTSQAQKDNLYRSKEILTMNTKAPLMCDETLLKTVISSLAQFNVWINATQRYDTTSFNCQSYSEAVLRRLGAIGFSERVQQCFENVGNAIMDGKKLERHRFVFKDVHVFRNVERFDFFETFESAFMRLKPLWKVTAAQNKRRTSFVGSGGESEEEGEDREDREWNECLRAGSVTFHNHAQLAVFTDEILQICPSFPYRCVESWTVLASFCAAYRSSGKSCRDCVFARPEFRGYSSPSASIRRRLADRFASL